MLIYDHNGELSLVEERERERFLTDSSLETLGIFSEVKFLDDKKKEIANMNDLKGQWKTIANSFVAHKWLFRYISEERKERLEKHYDILTNENTTYSNYKRSFRHIANFMGIPADKVIIEDLMFVKDKDDKEQWEVKIRYSKGLAKVQIPDGVNLIHVSTVGGITELVPTFRSKTKGKYMYPTKRIFFTVSKEIKSKQCGIQGSKRFRYTPKESIKYAYIDPTYSDFSSGAVYVETDKPIPVISLEKKLFGLLGYKTKATVENKKED